MHQARAVPDAAEMGAYHITRSPSTVWNEESTSSNSARHAAAHSRLGPLGNGHKGRSCMGNPLDANDAISLLRE